MSIKVLVADDSITIQKVIGIIFGGDEYSLTVVDNGKAAVEKAREIVPDILLIDALMPGMSGYEVAEAVRSTPSLSSKPILILTGSFEPFDEEKARKCGADDFISKPFESQQIILKVKDLLERESARAQTAHQPPQETTPDVTEFSASEISTPNPVFDQLQGAPQTSPPADIWSAFTPEYVTEAPDAFIPPATPSPVTSIEPDVFAIVSEEEDSQLMQTIIPPIAPQHPGSHWIPVEENTFEFEEENVSEEPQTDNTDAEHVQETSFGDISFEGTVATPSVPVFDTPEQEFTSAAEEESEPASDFSGIVTHTSVFEAPGATFAPLPDPIQSYTAPVERASLNSLVAAVEPSSTVPAEISEEQLKAFLCGVSKEIIEKIIWEIVPDLAEAMIQEAIRKIKEGA